MKPVLLGTRHAWDAKPDASHTAATIGNEGIDVVGSPFLIGWIEEACHRLLMPCYEEGEGTVGVGFELEHVAAAHPGRPVRLRAELVERDRRRFVFEASAEQDGRVVMRGRHARFLIDRERFAGEAPAPPSGKLRAVRAPPSLTFWFDVHSPWCFLAALRIGDLARRHRTPLAWRPLHLPRLIEQIGGRRPLEENAAFVRWYRRDLDDWAAMAGVEIRYHPDYPLRNSRALRACAWAGSEGRGEAFALRVLRGYWTAEAADISDPAVLAAMAHEVGLDGGAVPAVVAAPAWKQVVEDNTRNAIDAGVFGVPTVECAGRLFFGNDRLDLLERRISRGQIP